MNRRLALANAVGLLVGTSYGMHGPILPVFAREAAGASYDELGAIGFAAHAPYMAVPVVVGALLGRFRPGHMLSAGVVMAAASAWLLSAAGSVPEIMAYRALAGVAHAFFWPPCEAIVSEAAGPRGRVAGLSRFTGFFVAGFTAGPLAGSLFLGDGGPGYAALFQASALVLAASLAASAAAARGPFSAAPARPSLAGLRQLSRHPETVALLLYFTASFGAMLALYPAFLSDAGVSPVGVELLYFGFGASRVASLLAAGRLARRTGASLVAAALSVSAGMAAAHAGGHPAAHAAALALMGFGFSVFFPLTLGSVLSRAPEGRSRATIGAYEAVFGVGWAAGPVAAGLASQHLGAGAPYLAFAVLGAGAAALAAARRSSLGPGRPPGAGL